MTTYRCGPSVLRLRGRAQAIVPGDRFTHAFTPDEEALALASGSVVLVARDEADATPTPVASEDAPASETTRPAARSVRTRRAPSTDDET